VSCGCGGSSPGLARPSRNIVKFAAVVAVAWAVSKREWGLLVLAVAAFVCYRASQHKPGASVPASGGASTLSAPDSFSTGTDNVAGSPSPTTTVEGTTPSNSGSC